MYDRIVIATDGTEASANAVEYGIELAWAHDATVHALYVVDTANRMGHFDPVVEREEATGEDAVEAVADCATTVGVPSEKVFRYGRPSEEIVDYARAHDVDLVVVGKRDRSGFGRLVGGPSTANRVADRATVPVLVAGETPGSPPTCQVTPAN